MNGNTETGARRGAPALWYRTGDMALDSGNEPVYRARHWGALSVKTLFPTATWNERLSGAYFYYLQK